MNFAKFLRTDFLLKDLNDRFCMKVNNFQGRFKHGYRTVTSTI